MFNIDIRVKSIIFLLIAAILWSLGGVFIKLISWNAMTILGLRSLFTALIFLLIIKKPNFKFTINNLLIILCYSATMILFVISTKITTAANAILLQYTSPIYAAILGVWILKENIRKSDYLFMVLILFGMILFFIQSIEKGSLLGNIFAALSGVTYGAMHVFMRRGKEEEQIQCVFWGNVFIAVISIPFMFNITHTFINWSGILILAVFQFSLPYFLYCIAIKNVTALEAALIPMIEPILNPIWVLIVVGEKPGIYSIIGGIIVILAVMIRTFCIIKRQKLETNKFT